jgi:hypothetical protein
MPLDVRFEPIQLAGQYESEAAQLALANENLVAVLVRVDSTDLPRERQGWCLEIGFGPCGGEGILFPILEEAEAWIRSRVSKNWPYQGQHSALTRRPRQIELHMR